MGLLPKKKKKGIVEIHNVTVLESYGEIYPETGMKMVRPNVSIPRAVMLVLFVIAAAGLVSFGLLKAAECFDWYGNIPLSFAWQFVLLYLALLLLCLVIFARRMVIFVIKVYQKYAPYEIRCKCLFVPNCSEYMILAIRKYGLIKGVIKGIDRLKRCRGPNGGEDYP